MCLDKTWRASAAQLPHAPRYYLLAPSGQPLPAGAVPDPLGWGGQGICYLAEDHDQPDPRDSSKGCRVVIKFLWPRLDQQPHAPKVVAALGHALSLPPDNLVTVLEVLPAAPGQGAGRAWPPAQVMKPFTKTLKQLLKGLQGAGKFSFLPPAAARAIGCQIAHGLRTLHKLGFVHQDLKLANLALNFSGERSEIADLQPGSFTALVADLSTLARIGQDPGYRVDPGNSDYMAPERHQAGLPDPAWDVYALGRLLEDLYTYTNAQEPDLRRWSRECLVDRPPRPSAEEVCRALERRAGDGAAARRLQGRLGAWPDANDYSSVIRRDFVDDLRRLYLDECYRQGQGGLQPVVGGPGTGKTALLYLLAMDGPSTLSYFFKHDQFSDPLAALGELTTALWERLGYPAPADPEATAAEVKERFAGALDAWGHEARGQTLLRIVIDAVDECTNPELLWQCLPERLNRFIDLVVATRPLTPGQRERFWGPWRGPRLEPDWVIDLEAHRHHEGNVDAGGRFVRSRLGEKLATGLCQQIAEVGAGNFMFLQAFCEEIRHDWPVAEDQIQRRLAQLHTDPLPLLDAYFADSWRRLETKHAHGPWNEIRDVAALMAVAFEPLTDHQIYRILKHEAAGLTAGAVEQALEALAEWIRPEPAPAGGDPSPRRCFRHGSFQEHLRGGTRTSPEPDTGGTPRAAPPSPLGRLTVRMHDRVANFFLHEQETAEHAALSSYGSAWLLRHLLLATVEGFEGRPRVPAAVKLLCSPQFLRRRLQPGQAPPAAAGSRPAVYALWEDLQAVAGQQAVSSGEPDWMRLLARSVAAEARHLRASEDAFRQLTPQLYNRLWLMEGKNPAVRQWLAEFAQSAGEPWLCRLNAAGTEPVPSLVFGVGGRARALAAPGPERLAVLDEKGSVDIWEIREQPPRSWRLPHEGPPVTAVAGVGLVGLAVGTAEGAIWLWDFRGPAGRPLSRRHARAVKALTWLGGQRLASLDKGGRVWVWDLADLAAAPEELPALHGEVQALAWLGGQDLAAVHRADQDRQARDGTALLRVQIWDLGSQPPYSFQVTELPEQQLLLGRAGTQLVTAGGDGHVSLWDVSERPALPQPLPEPRVPVQALEVLGETRLVTGGKDGVVRVWDLEHLRRPPRELGHARSVTAVTALERDRLASVGHDLVVRVWDLRLAPAPVPPVGRPLGRVHALAWGGKKRLAAVGARGGVQVWDLHDLERPAWTFAVPAGDAHALTWLDERCLAVVGANGKQYLWDWRHPDEQPQEQAGPEGPFTTFAVLPDSPQVAATRADGLLWTWSLRDPRRPTRVGMYNGPAAAVTWLGEQRLAAAGKSLPIFVWGLGALAPRQLGGFRTPLPALAGLGSHWLAAAGEDKLIRIWDLNAPGEKPLRELSGHKGPVRALATLGTKWLASAAERCSVRLWDLSKPDAEACVARFEGDYPFTAVALYHPNTDGTLWLAAFDGNAARPSFYLWELRQPGPAGRKSSPATKLR